MKAVKIDCYMEMAHFKCPNWFDSLFTYPLPPPSTVVGMVCALCNWKEKHEIRVSIAGSPSGIDVENVRRWKGGAFSSVENEEFKARFPIRVKGVSDRGKPGYIGWVSGTARLHYLSDLHLRLHINAENQDDIKNVYNAFLHPRFYPSLGRREDLVRIDAVKIVEITSYRQLKKIDLSAWTPVEPTRRAMGTVYKLHKDWKIKNDRRIFDDTRVFLSDKGCVEVGQVDEEGDLVFFL